MIRVGFLGCDSTHTEAYGSRLNDPSLHFGTEARVVALWGTDVAQARQKAHSLGIEYVGETPESVVDRVDLVMAIGRFGDSHFGPARVALDRGKPTFVDKPLTCSTREAMELAELSEKRGAPLMSASPLRFSRELVDLKRAAATDEVRGLTILGPAHCIDLQGDARFGSVFFYGIHAIEMLLEIIPLPLERVEIWKSHGSSTARLRFATGREALLHLLRNVEEFYSVHAAFRTSVRLFNVTLDGSYYTGALRHILNDFYRDRAGIALQSSVDAVRILAEIEAFREA